MKRLAVTLVSVWTIFGLAEPLALASVSQFSSVHCGSHWLAVDIELAARSNQAVVHFSGDSNPDPARVVGTYRFTSENNLVVALNPASDERIEIDGQDASHNIYWGTYFPGLEGGEYSLGFCSVEL